MKEFKPALIDTHISNINSWEEFIISNKDTMIMVTHNAVLKIIIDTPLNKNFFSETLNTNLPLDVLALLIEIKVLM